MNNSGLEIGSVICEAHSLYEFLNELQSFTKKWNKMKNGLVLEPNTNVRIQAVEEHTELANEVTVAEDTGQSGESVDNIEKKDAFIDIINTLSSQYGSLRIVQNNNDWEHEANGLCYLNLIDFTGDGKEELMAVCKNEDEEHYTGYIYTIKDGSVELLYENPIIEYNFFQGFDVVNLGYTADTGYVFGTGWEDADADDMTFFWYKDGKFEPVYRYNGYWDGDLDDEVIYEESIIVDIFDDDHRDEYYNNSPSVTLRTMSDINVDGDDFSLDDLQRNIDIVIQKLEGDSNTSNVDRTDAPSINEDINYDEFTMEELEIPYGHYYGGKPQGEGVFGLDLDLYDDMTFSIQSSFDLFSDEDGDEYSYTGTYKINRIDDDGNPVLLLHCDEGDYEFVWNGEQLLHDPIFAWYEGESSTREDGNSGYSVNTINEPEESSEDGNDSWKESYVDYIENDSDIAASPEWCTCGLIYLDDDEIPELIIDYGIEASGTRIVSFKNGETESALFARTGGIHYIEREGLVYNSIGHQGVMYDQLSYLDNEGFHSLGQGSRYGEEQDFIHYTHFNWNNEEVSEEEYYSNINSQFDDEQSVRWDSYSDDLPGSTYRYPPDEMCEYLLDN